MTRHDGCELDPGVHPLKASEWAVAPLLLHLPDLEACAAFDLIGQLGYPETRAAYR